MFFGRGLDLWLGKYDKKTKQYKSNYSKPRGGSTIFGFYSKQAKFFMMNSLVVHPPYSIKDDDGAKTTFSDIIPFEVQYSTYSLLDGFTSLFFQNKFVTVAVFV